MITQYAASDHPDVVSVVQRNIDGYRAALDACLAWAGQYGDNPSMPFYPQTFGGGMGIVGVPFTGDPPSGWVRAGSRGWRPRKGSAIYRDMIALHWSPEPVPGLSEVYEAPKGDGQMWWMWARPFVWSGFAWVLLGHMPTQGEFGEQWHEVRASEAYRAREEYDDARKAGELP